MSMSRSLASLLAAALVAGSAWADRVVLHNGEVFDEVIAQVRDGQVWIRLEYGEIRLPENLVKELERSQSVLARFLERRRRLQSSEEAEADEWLALARWALAEGLDHGGREAALRAAELDPWHEDVGPLMRRIGYVLDREHGIWVRYDRRPRAAPPSPVAAEPAARESTAQHAGDGTSIEERLAHAVELLASAEAQRAAQPRARPVPPPHPYYPVVAAAGWVLPARSRPGGPGTPARPDPLLRELVRRQPGSLLPYPRPHTPGLPTVRRSGY